MSESSDDSRYVFRRLSGNDSDSSGPISNSNSHDEALSESYRVMIEGDGKEDEISRINDTIKIIRNRHVNFDTSGLIKFLSAEKVTQRHLNKFDNIESTVKLLNTILYYKVYDDLNDESNFTKFYNEFDDRIAVENSFKWTETYNEIIESIGGDGKIDHSCLIWSCTEDTLKEMFNEGNDIVKRFYEFKKRLEDAGIHNIGDTSIDNCTEIDNISSKICPKLYLETYYEYMQQYPRSPIWHYLIDGDIRKILTDLSASYCLSGDFFRTLNDLLRNDHERYLSKKETDHFINVMKAMVFPVTLSEDLVVYRGDGFDESSDIIKTKGFYSSSLDFQRARDYMENHPDTDYKGRIIQIKIPSGQKFLVVNSFKNRPCGEPEIVIMPYTTMKRDNCEENGGILFCKYTVESTYQLPRTLRNNLFNVIVGDKKKSLVYKIIKEIKSSHR